MTGHIPCELPFPRIGEQECPCKPPGGSRAPSSAVNIYPRGEGVGRGNSLISCYEKFEDCAILVRRFYNFVHGSGFWWLYLAMHRFTDVPRALANSTAYLSIASGSTECFILHHFLSACTTLSSHSWFVVGDFGCISFCLSLKSRHSHK